MKTPNATLDQWRTLYAVIEHGSLEKAADALYRSQSAVSYTLSRLQSQLGVSLLRKSGRRTVLTEAGWPCYPTRTS